MEKNIKKKIEDFLLPSNWKKHNKFVDYVIDSLEDLDKRMKKLEDKTEP